MNLLSLVSPWLDNNYHKQIKVLQCHKIFSLRKLNTDQNWPQEKKGNKISRKSRPRDVENKKNYLQQKGNKTAITKMEKKNIYKSRPHVTFIWAGNKTSGIRAVSGSP